MNNITKPNYRVIMKTALNQLKEWLENATKQCEETYNATDAEKFPSISISTYAMLSAYNMVLDQIESLLPTEQSQTEGLKKEIEELKKKTEWISVKERLPEFNIDVLVRGEKMGANPSMDGASTFITHRQNPKGTSLERQAYKYVDDNYFKAKYVTHWMPLPTPPNQ